mmetsp:Transcript_46518/g.83171  ORF Transcript_46518/g.83171 Transcript_46518/m.83171 type:complete len:217 (-) Transcript_46518:1601-2251(-)
MFLLQLSHLVFHGFLVFLSQLGNCGLQSLFVLLLQLCTLCLSGHLIASFQFTAILVVLPLRGVKAGLKLFQPPRAVLLDLFQSARMTFFGFLRDCLQLLHLNFVGILQLFDGLLVLLLQLTTLLIVLFFICFHSSLQFLLLLLTALNHIFQLLFRFLPQFLKTFFTLTLQRTESLLVTFTQLRQLGLTTTLLLCHICLTLRNHLVFQTGPLLLLGL